MKHIEQYQHIIETAINNIALPDSPKDLYEPVRYIMSLGGKRIRPVLTLLSCELFGGDASKAVQPAIALEVFHNFTLVHDDIMDNAAIRRGKPTVHTRWDNNTAILSGDVMLVLAYELLSQVPSHILPQALKLFNDSSKWVCEGQQMDMDFEKQQTVSIDAYIEMIGLKTAALLAASLQMGALIAETSAENIALIKKFGHNIGIAFQIQDDLLDSFGSEADFGKRIGGDIVANKKTFLTIKAIELADASQKQILHDLYNKSGIPDQEKINQVMAIYLTLGIRTHAEKAMDTFYGHAMDALRNLAAPEESKISLRLLADSLISRNR